MHESGVIEDLLKTIQSAARENNATRVVAVELAVGALAGIEPEHLRGHFEVAAAGTVAEGAELRITLSDDPFDSGAYGIILQAVEVET